MNQKLFTQIRNEWRINLWLCIELLVVSVLVWYIVDYMYVSYKVHSEPLGFDVEHCYLIDYGSFKEGDPLYVERSAEELTKKRCTWKWFAFGQKMRFRVSPWTS